MLEPMARSIRRNGRGDYYRDSVSRPATFLRFQVNRDDSDLIVGPVSDEIDASLHELVDQIAKYLAFGVVGSRHPQRNFNSLGRPRIYHRQTEAQAQDLERQFRTRSNHAEDNMPLVLSGNVRETDTAAFISSASQAVILRSLKGCGRWHRVPFHQGFLRRRRVRIKPCTHLISNFLPVDAA